MIIGPTPPHPRRTPRMARMPALMSLVCAAVASGAPHPAHPPTGAGHGDHGPDHTHATGDGTERLRSWTDERRGISLQAAFLAWRDGTVLLEDPAGAVHAIPIADLEAGDREYAEARIAAIRAMNATRAAPGAAAPSAPRVDGAGAATAPAQAEPFARFEPFVHTRWDDEWLYVESDGLPHAPGTHPLMVGIRSWQQQVPLPQAYRGDNAWRIPMRPVPAVEPLSARTLFRRGAIALAANGVPIFNPLNNRGDDAFLAGELDEYGGHAGRADDYHYHVAPLALAKVLGPELPIAYALDGYPIYGLFDPAAAPGAAEACPLGGRDPLDQFNGHAGRTAAGEPGPYHYHASRSYPYVNGGFHGRVRIEDDQVEPQPRATPVRQWLTPLRGATITEWAEKGPDSWMLAYVQDGARHEVDYRRIEDPAGARVEFRFLDPDGRSRTESYPLTPGPRGAPPPRDGGPAPPRATPPAPATAPATAPPTAPGGGGFSVRCPAVGSDGRLPTEFTCDGAGRAPPLEWSNPPAGTNAFAITMHHDPGPSRPGEDARASARHVYLVVHGLPGDVRSLAAGDAATGVRGLNSVNDRPEYAPPCSKGPGVKRYTVTVHALSAPPRLPHPERTTMAELEEAIRGITLGTATVDLAVEREAPGAAPPPRPRGGDARPERGMIQRMSAFHTEVPDHPWDVLLAQPTATSITVSVASRAAAPMEAFVERGTPAELAARSTPGTTRTPTQVLPPGRPVSFVLQDLPADSEVAYRLWTRAAAPQGAGGRGSPGRDEGAAGGAEPPFTPDQVFRFHTPRPPGAPFVFTIQADSHLDPNMDPAVYAQALANAAADRPDFHVDLGDTFMVDKRRDFHDALPQYAAQRWYLGQLCRQAPLFQALGNHDGERGDAAAPRRGETDAMGPWSFEQRTLNFPPPATGGAGSFASGRTSLMGGRGANYFEFTWGDAQCIVLDPFWATESRPRGGPQDGAEPSEDGWAWTLGREQYEWLRRTLAASSPRYRFVFTHHLVGGLSRTARGGAEASPYFEWGGRNADGSEGFKVHRPDWEAPIHALLSRSGVSAVFHGHDHLYVQNERDGVIYQCVPQPGNAQGGTRSAAEYGYAGGVILGSPGHLRVRVEPAQATVEYVRAATDGTLRNGGNGADGANASVVRSYAIPARRPGGNGPGADAAGRPNVIFILAEGLGWSGTSVEMDPAILDQPPLPGLTPALERLAADGARCGSFHVSAPRCTPARASFLTGRSAAALHMTYVNEEGREKRRDERPEPLLQRMIGPASVGELPTEVETLPERLRACGYRTAHFGKWHVGRLDPATHGFELNDGPNTNAGPGGNRAPNPAEGRRITERGIRFMEECAAARTPFYLQLSHYGAGTEAEVTPAALEATRGLLQAAGLRVERERDLVRLAAVRDLDCWVADVMAAVARLGLRERTYLIFSSDHGAPGGNGRRAPGVNAPFMGAKGSVREGGVRVPFIVAGPGVTPGATLVQVACSMDLAPTVLDLAGCASPADGTAMAMEGGSLAPLLRGVPGATISRPAEGVVVHFPHHDLGNGGPASAIFLGSYKLIRNDETGERLLFDLQADPRESADVAFAHPEVVRDLEARLDAHLTAINAPRATPAESAPPRTPPGRRDRPRDPRVRRRPPGPAPRRATRHPG